MSGGDTVVEKISDSCKVSRLVFEFMLIPPDLVELFWEKVFMFPSNRNCRESVVWRKYKPSDEDVHELGAEQQEARRRDANSTPKIYKGFLNADVDKIRSISCSDNIHKVFVEHVPSEGIHHAEIFFEPSPPKSVKMDFKTRLKMVFSKEITVP